MQDIDTFPDRASMAAPAILKYDESHKLRQISVGRGGISLNPCTAIDDIGRLADLEQCDFCPLPAFNQRGER